MQFIERSELNRLGRTRLGAGGRQPAELTVRSTLDAAADAQACAGTHSAPPRIHFFQANSHRRVAQRLPSLKRRRIVAMRRLLAICGLIGVGVVPAGSGEPLSLAVSPAYTFAPGMVRVRARIEPNADNRCLTIVADGSSFYRSSEIQLDGEQAPKTFELFFKDVPGGEYEVSAFLTGTSGHRRVTARSTLTVMSPIGD
jgi:hypothetical protein